MSRARKIKKHRKRHVEITMHDGTKGVTEVELPWEERWETLYEKRMRTDPFYQIGINFVSAPVKGGYICRCCKRRQTPHFFFQGAAYRRWAKK